MRFKQILAGLFITFLTFSRLNAQELNCRVQINTQQIAGTDKAVYESFSKTVQEYMNTTHFSSLKLENQEKIDCSMTFVFKSTAGNTHTCDFQIQSSRPVYGSNYVTTLLSFKEELTFDYQENQAITFNETTVNDNLTATLNFWAYLILGLDFDSFSKLGGSPFFQRAQDIVTQAQGNMGDLWKTQTDRNHWGWSNVLNNENQPEMRILSYEYHRNGLDAMYQNPQQGRTVITESLNKLKTAKQAKSRSPLISNFIDCKSEELCNLYSKAEEQEKQAVYNLMISVYPAAVSRLQGIKTQK